MGGIVPDRDAERLERDGAEAGPPSEASLEETVRNIQSASKQAA